MNKKTLGWSMVVLGSPALLCMPFMRYLVEKEQGFGKDFSLVKAALTLPLAVVGSPFLLLYIKGRDLLDWDCP